MLFRKVSNLLVKCHRVAKFSDATIFPKDGLSTDQQSKILEVVNANDGEHLSKLQLPDNSIKNIQDWKDQNGEFKTLSDILEASDLGEGTLGKSSKDIYGGKPTKTSLNGNKRLKQLVTPPLPINLSTTLSSAVGVHISSLGISWAKISRDGNKLDSWNFQNFSTLPKKMHATETFDLAIKVMPRIPPADVYVFESSATLSPQGQTQTATVTSYNQLTELNCMLLSLINTSLTHNISLQADHNRTSSKSSEIENRVFYLRSKVPARLFRTLVGTERVAAVDIVTKLIESTSNSPCTEIKVDSQIRGTYRSQSPANKELLGQALMLIISFMDLCVYKNTLSIAAIAPNRKK